MNRIFFLSLLLIGCGSDAEPAAQSTPASTASAPVPTGGPIAADPDVRQRLSPAQLLTFLPENAGRFEHYGMDQASDPPEAEAPGRDPLPVSSVSKRYWRDSGSSSPERIKVRIADHIDADLFVFRRELDENRYASSQGGYGGDMIEAGELDGFPVQRIKLARSGPTLRVLIADRFLVSLHADRNDQTPITFEDLEELFRSTPLARLADAPAFADAGSPDVPEWASEAIAGAEARAAETIRQRGESTEAPRALVACDALLPADEVARVTGTSSEARPTPFESDGENCNRGYTLPGRDGRLLLIVSALASESSASSGARVATSYSDDLSPAPLPGLSGFMVSDPTLHWNVAAFAVGTTLVELRAVPDMRDSSPLSLDDLETLARGIADRLAD